METDAYLLPDPTSVFRQRRGVAEEGLLVVEQLLQRAVDLVRDLPAVYSVEVQTLK